VSKDHGSKDHGHKGHHDEHGSHRQYEQEQAKKRGLHKDWRTWTVVLLMLAGILTYVATLDLAFLPWSKSGQRTSAPMPADAAP
jgi:hypothetical protein